MMNSTAGNDLDAKPVTTRDILGVLKDGPATREALVARFGQRDAVLTRVVWLLRRDAIATDADGRVCLPEHLGPLGRMTDEEQDADLGRELWREFGVLLLAPDMAPDAYGRQLLHVLGCRMYGRRR